MSGAPITILGAGIAGLSASYHFGHERCIVFDQRPSWGGHTRSESLFGYTFDQGPHVSFTKHAYVRELFERATEDELREFEVRTRNYYRGGWIDHPAQAHLWQIPEPLRSQCYAEMLAAAKTPSDGSASQNYQQWLVASFGDAFASSFPVAYTRKYWATEPADLTTDWVASRIHRPSREQIDAGMQPGTHQAVHYITRVRYPTRGGFQAFLAELAGGVCLQAGKSVASIDLAARRLWFSDGSRHDYDRLVSTLPLDAFVNCCQNVPSHVREAAAALDCSQLLLVNVCAPHPSPIDGHWFYVYDEDKRATRIHLAERLAPSNAPANHTAVQAEVYFGRGRPFAGDPVQIAQEVARELVEMGFIDEGVLAHGEAHVFWRWAPYANIIFTHDRRQAMDEVLSWLEGFGCNREPGDLDAATEWDTAPGPIRPGSLMLAGRFAQWKYYWTDDCVLRGRQLAGADR